MSQAKYIKINVNDVKINLINKLINFAFEHEYILYGNIIWNYMLVDPKKRVIPKVIDLIKHPSIKMKDAIKKINDNLKFTFEINKIDRHMNIEGNNEHMNEDINEDNDENIDNDKDKDKNLTINLELTYNFFKDNPIKFNLNIHTESIILNEQIFDIDNIIMSNDRTFKLIDDVPSCKFIEIFNNIQSKKFKLNQKFSPPTKSRNKLGITEASNDLLIFIKSMNKTRLLLEKGWKLSDQKIENIFNPCIIHKINVNTVCNICNNDLKIYTYGIKLNCCSQILCFNCCIKHINAKFYNSEISCPYCRGDLFGWNTTNTNNLIQHNNENNINSNFNVDDENNDSGDDDYIDDIDDNYDNSEIIDVIENYDGDIIDDGEIWDNDDERPATN